MVTLRAGVRMMHRIAAAPPLSDYAGVDRHPVDLDDAAALDALIRSRADTVYHPVGPCRQGNDAAAVVDPALKLNGIDGLWRSDEPTSDLQSLMRNSYAVFCLATKNNKQVVKTKYK